jgi:hypothetical protein
MRAITPALRQGTETVPLTDRKAEIVMLIGEGLSNRDVAVRLTLFRPHGRKPHLPCHVEDRDHEPRTACRIATSGPASAERPSACSVTCAASAMNSVSPY